MRKCRNDKRIASLLVLALIFTALFSGGNIATPTINALASALEFKSDKNYVVLMAENFANHLGSWQMVHGAGWGSLTPYMLLGTANHENNSDNPAIAKIGIPKSGIYKVMVHLRDYGTGNRTFKLQIGDDEAAIYGDHPYNGWMWQESVPTPYFRGEYDLKLIDYNGYYARVDMIIVTDDLDFTVEDSAENMEALVTKVYVPGSVGPEPPDNNRPPDEIAVKLNGDYLDFDVPPIMTDDEPLVPFRRIFEALGCTVSWDEENQIATASRNGTITKVTIGSNAARVAGDNILLDRPAILKDGEAMVPLQLVSESLNAAVLWDEQTKTVEILALIPKAVYLFNYSSFQQIGTWTIEKNSEAFGGITLKGLIPLVEGAEPGDADPSGAQPAIATFKVVEAGQYKVWVRSMDHNTYPGARFFNIGINSQMIDKRFGTHGTNGFRWEDGGVINLSEGDNTLWLYDTSGFFARCDMVMITEDVNMAPPEDYQSILKIGSPLDPLGYINVVFPHYATEQNEPTNSVSIENDDTKVVFYKVPTRKGQVIQNEIYSKSEGQWIKTKNRSEELGYMIIAADNAKNVQVIEDMYAFTTGFRINGNKISYLGNEIYKSGLVNWFIPTDYQRTADNEIKLLFDNELADVTATWQLESDNKAPLVSLDVTFNRDGFYTIGAWEGSEMTFNQFDFALAPYRVQSKRVHNTAGLIAEKHLFTPMGTYTLTEDNQYAPGKKITKGVAVESSWLPLRWVYDDNSLFGINMKGPNYNYRAAVFAPVMGSPESNIKAGDAYNLKYRVISTVGDWFETYRFVANDIFNVCDYRQNNNVSLNEAIFNTRRLMMDDVYSGWDVYDKAHYNMEGKNRTSSANPMEALQVYLLTEDKDVLTKRAIPTIANTLTRQGVHFNRHTEGAGSNLPNSIGTPIAEYKANVYLGMYEMTRGGVPFLYQYGLEKGQQTLQNSYGSIAPFSNSLNLYKYTGNEQYLNKAIEQADEYLKEVVYAPQTGMVEWSKFIYISYYPNLASLIDIYEITNEQKYLDAAKHVAQWLATTLWVPGIDGEKLNQPIEVNDIDEIKSRFHYGREDSPNFWWYGDKQFRVGRETGLTDESSNTNITEKHGYAPAWITSRVGLGLEQSSTFGKSSNIIMSSWVGDFLKLGRYTGENYFVDTARNAIIGRFANYSGYYQNTFITYQQYPEYPYEGPDYTGIYWHHLPPFLAMLEDFLINMAQTWSNGNISFPSLRQQGYAYFNSNQYGFKPGNFFGESDMWLWLDEGVLETDNIQIDWLGAKKDGVAGFVLLNESAQETTTTITLGDKVQGGKDFTGKATVYDSSKSESKVRVINGRFQITIPAKSLKAVIFKLPDIKAPAYSKMHYKLNGSVDLDRTLSEHKNGKAYVLQMTPENYYAYVYITDKPDQISSLTMNYRIGDDKECTVTTDVYPYEFIIEVPNASQDFSYDLVVTNASGAKENRKGGAISPAKK